MDGIPKDIQGELSKVLEFDEKPIDFRKEPWSFYKRNRWVVLTNKRVYLIKKMLFGLTFDITQIVLERSNFEMIEGVILDTIYIMITGSVYFVINFLPKDRERTIEFFERIEKARDSQMENGRQVEEASQKMAARAELEALAKTFYENKISSDEYNKKKKKLIDRL